LWLLEINDAFGEMVLHDSSNHKTLCHQSRIVVGLKYHQSITDISGCESMVASFKYDNEGDDEAMVVHHESLGEESSVRM
jgi:hypothetical protein